MNGGRLKLGDLVSWKPVQWVDFICYGVIVRKDVKFVDSDRIMYTVYTQSSEFINFFQDTVLELRMKVECRDVQ